MFLYCCQREDGRKFNWHFTKDGSTLKFAVKGKWQKIPARVEFRKEK